MDVSLISSADNVTDARLHRLSGALLRNGLSLEIRALGNSADAPAGAIFHKAPGGRGFADRIIRDLYLPFVAKGKVIVVVAPDLLVTTKLIAALRRKKIVADVHEDYVELLRDRAWAQGLMGKVAKVVAKLATSAAAKSDLTTVADTQVPPFNARQRLVIRNLPDLSLLTPSGSRDTQPRAIYIGDVRTSRGLRMILAIADISPEWIFDIVGQVAPLDADFVADWLATSPAASRVNFHGKLAPSASWAFAEGAWVGLSLLEATPAFRAAIPSKLYEYMAVGLATISTSLPRSQALLEESAAGLCADSAEAVAHVLDRWLHNQHELDQIRENASRWASQHFDGASEYQAFASAVTRLLKP
jgi:glycosyltransferase involved in cell wall biosynthesis